MEHIVLRESYGSTPNKKIYVRGPTDDIRVVVKSEKLTSGSQFFREVFLPKGYPESVSSDYLVYQAWDTIQMVQACWEGSYLLGCKGHIWTVIARNGDCLLMSSMICQYS